MYVYIYIYIIFIILAHNNNNNNNNHVRESVVLVNIHPQTKKTWLYLSGVREGAQSPSVDKPMLKACSTVSLRTKTLDFRGLDSIIILMLRGGILMSKGNVLESLSQLILVGIILVGRLAVIISFCPRLWPEARLRPEVSNLGGRQSSSQNSASNMAPSVDKAKATIMKRWKSCTLKGWLAL